MIGVKNGSSGDFGCVCRLVGLRCEKMTIELAFNLLWGVVCGALGLLYKSTQSRLDRIEKSIDNFAHRADEHIDKLTVHVGKIMTDYSSRSELTTSLGKIERQLERIEDKLERKADK